MNNALASLATLLLICSSYFSDLSAQCDVGESQFKVIINPDRYPDEVTWDLLNEQGDIVATGNSESDSTCVVSQECHRFIIYDSAGDGLCCRHGDGSYQVYIDNVLIHEGGEYDREETVLLGCPVGFSCFDVDTIGVGMHTAPNTDYWYAFIPDETARYTVSTCDVNTCNTILFIYDDCRNYTLDDSNVGTSYYNDDDCDEQSRIIGSFEEGETYYLRIGDLQDLCGSNSIQFEIIYNGPIEGCTDPNGCNYNPLATLDDGSCVYEGEDCPGGADLIVDETEFVNSLELTTEENQDQCTIDEGCLGGFNQRDIIRFTTHIANIGDEDFYVGRPTEDNPLYTYDNCHEHWHYRGYAEYILYDEEGVALPIGFKNGFCVLDLDCSAGGVGKYSCNNQGISAQCADIYGSYLSCQWIDITDVDPGVYTFVIRVNWERSPDASGNYESNYENNWAQVCIDIGRDTDDRPTLSLVDDCDSFVDCLGEIYGSAQPDCKGDCNGNAVKGDLDLSGVLEDLDAQAYMAGIVDRTLTDATTCNDLNGDGTIHVSDVAKLAACLYFGDGSIDPDAPNEPCVFGEQIENPNQEVEFSVMNVNTDENYFELGLFNETSYVLAYELNLIGGQIVDVQSMITSGEYSAEPEFVVNGDKILSVSMNHESILKKLEMEPILRIYFTPTADELCFEIEEVINEDYHKILHSIDEGCVSMLVNTSEQDVLNASIRVQPNPARNNMEILAPVEFGRIDQLIIRDVQGKVVYRDQSNLESNINLNVQSWASGIYFFELIGERQARGKFLVL